MENNLEDTRLILKDQPMFITNKLISSLFSSSKIKKVEKKNTNSLSSIIQLEFSSVETKKEFLKKNQNYKLKDFNMYICLIKFQYFKVHRKVRIQGVK